MSPDTVTTDSDCGSPDPQKILRMLETRGIVPTPQRMHICEVIFCRMQHLTADQVIDKLQERGTPVSKATVYSTLKLFADKGLVRQINIDPDRACFDSNTSPHYHFHNVDTGELIDVSVPSVQLERLPSLPEGTELAGVDVVLRVRRKAS